MSDFNPEIAQTDIPNFPTTQGLGGVTDTSLGNLFKDAGNLLDAGVKVTDNAIKSDIRHQVYDAADQVRAEFGVDDATLLESPINTAAQPLPEDIQQAATNLNNLKTAVAQGRLSDAQYYARLETSVRQIRARYPGYRPEIDQMVSSITGVTPANALRSELMQEASQLASQGRSLEKDFTSYMASNEKYLPPNAYERYNNGGLSQLDIKSYVTGRKQEDAAVASRKADLDLAVSTNNFNKNQALIAARTEIRTIGDRMFKDATSGLGKDFSSFQQAVQRANADRRITPEEEAQLRSAFGTLKQNYSLAIDASLNTPWGDSGASFSTTLGSTELQGLRAEALGKIDIFEKALTDGNFGLLAANSALIEAKKQEGTLAIYDNDRQGVFGRLGALTQIAGPNFANTILINNPELLDAASKTVLNAATAEMGATDTTMGEQVSKIKASGLSDAKVYKGLVDNTISALTDKTITPEAFEQFAKNTFGPANYNVFANFKQSEKLDLFNKLTSPAVTRRMIEESKNNPDLWNMYQGWAKSRFTELFRQEAANINVGITSQDYAKISFDPKSERFVYTPTALSQQRPAPYSLDAYWNTVQAADALRSVNKINQALQVMKPILEHDGSSVSDQLELLFGPRGLGIDLNAPREQDFFHALGAAVMRQVGKVGDRLKEEAAAGRAMVAQQNLIDAVIDTESKGDPNAVSSEGARGLMQITDKTGGDPGYGVTPLQNDTPEENVRFGTDYLNALLSTFGGNETLALAAYNAGPGNVNKWISQFGDPRSGKITDADWLGKVPFKETRDYVSKVTTKRDQLASE